MSTEEKDLEEDKGGKPQGEECKPKDDKEAKAADDCKGTEAKGEGEEECKTDDESCKGKEDEAA